jgi:glycosyltransferase involved in cell wall biosynthesis
LNVLDAWSLRKYSRKIIYNFDDAVMYSDKNPQRYRHSHFVPFRRSVRLADLVITGSAYLAEHARRFNSNVEVLSLGLKVSDYRPDCPAKADDKIRLVWIGSRTTLGYLEEIKPAIEDVGARCDRVILRIICEEFLELNNLSVEKRLWSMETRGIDLATSDIGLAPLPDNRFTRGKCSFKVLEYSAAGLPVVASPVGTNSDYVKDGVTGFLADGARQWTDRMMQLIQRPELRRKMGQDGRTYAETFDITVIGERLSKLIIRSLL